MPASPHAAARKAALGLLVLGVALPQLVRSLMALVSGRGLALDGDMLALGLFNAVPFALLAAIVLIARAAYCSTLAQRRRPLRLGVFLATLVPLFMGLWLQVDYHQRLFGGRRLSSTHAVVFVMGPMMAAVGALAVLALTWGIARLLMRKA